MVYLRPNHTTYPPFIYSSESFNYHIIINIKIHNGYCFSKNHHFISIMFSMVIRLPAGSPTTNCHRSSFGRRYGSSHATCKYLGTYQEWMNIDAFFFQPPAYIGRGNQLAGLLAIVLIVSGLSDIPLLATEGSNYLTVNAVVGKWKVKSLTGFS